MISTPEVELAAMTLTNSKQVAAATRMDEIQRIIEEQKESGEGEADFFQVKVIQISEGGCQEVMIQIQNVSARVQSQFLSIERQYMSIMNSTVSHEMRNPLNAIVSQI